MKTYSESQGEKSFDWWEALENFPEVGSDEHKKLMDMSGDWITCACGNQCDVIPRDLCGVPYDPELYKLGCNFCRNICLADVEKAKETLRQIEARSAELIKEINGNNGKS